MKKGISLVALIITVIVLLLITGIAISQAIGDEGIVDSAQSTFDSNNKNAIIDEIQREIKVQGLKKSLSGGDNNLDKTEIIEIMEIYGKYNYNSMKIVTDNGLEISILEVADLPIEEYMTITKEDGMLIIETPLANYGYIVEYVKNNGKTWRKYVVPIAITEADDVYVRLKIENSGSTTKAEDVSEIIDTVQPSISIIVDNPNASQFKNVTIQVTDNKSLVIDPEMYKYYVSTESTYAEGVTWESYTPGEQFQIGTGLNGTYYIHVKSVSDMTGNESGAKVSAGCQFDNTAPTVNFQFSSSSVVTLTANDELSGIDPEGTVIFKTTYNSTEYTKEIVYKNCNGFDAKVLTNNEIIWNSYDTVKMHVTLQDKAGNVFSQQVYNGTAYCFVEGTKVVTEEGLVNIEDVMIGQNVYTYNNKQNKVELQKVTNKIVSIGKTYQIKTQSGDVIEGAGEHKMYVNGFGYKKIKDIKVNDKLVAGTGDLIVVESINITNENKILYNLDVEQNGNFFIEGNMYLVEDIIQEDQLLMYYNEFLYRISNCISNIFK